MKGRELINWRKEQFLSQHDLARMLGVHVNSIQNWEAGRNVPHEEMLDLALDALTQRRTTMVRQLRRARERLAHKRRLKAIAQGVTKETA